MCVGSSPTSGTMEFLNFRKNNGEGVDSFYSETGLWRQEPPKRKWYNFFSNEGKIYDPAFVKKENGKFYCGFTKNTDDYIEIPEEIAKYIIVGILLEKKLRRKFKYDTRDLENESMKLYLRFNCHKTVETILKTEAGILINSATLTNTHEYSDYESFLAFIRNFKRFPALARIIRNFESGSYLDHSFITLGILKSGEVLCVEKEGPSYLPFRIVSLRTVLEYYKTGSVDLQSIKI